MKAEDLWVFIEKKECERLKSTHKSEDYSSFMGTNCRRLANK